MFELVRRTGITLLIRVISAVIVFVSSFLLTQELGTQKAGMYFFIFTFVTVINSTLGNGGGNYLLKKYGEQNGFENALILVNVFLLSIVESIILSVLLLCFLFLFNPNVGMEVGHFYVIIFFISSVFSVVNILIANALQAIGQTTFSSLSMSVYQQLSFLFLFYLNPVSDLNSMILNYFTSVIFSFIISFFVFFIFLKRKFIFILPDFIFYKEIISLKLTQFFTQINVQLPIFILGFISTLENVAYFSVTMRFVFILGLLWVSVNKVFSPYISNSFLNGDFLKFKRYFKLSTFILIGLSWPFVIISCIMIEEILILFGDDFVNAKLTTIIVLISYAIYLSFGMTSIVLIMCNKVRIQKNISFLSICVNAICCIIFIPYLGSIGAAISLATSLIVSAIFSFYFLLKLDGFKSESCN